MAFNTQNPQGQFQPEPTPNYSAQGPQSPFPSQNPPRGGIPTIAKVFILLIAVGSFVLAHFLINRHNSSQPGAGSSSPGDFAQDTTAVTEIGVAYGTEKRGWLEWAVAEFAKSAEGQKIKVVLKPMGSQEGAQAIVRGNDSAKSINVWCPASSLYKEIFVSDWEGKYATNPIAYEDHIALTPMVYVFWQERYDAFVQKYGTVNFDTIGQALAAKTGWAEIANKPDWGLFKFGHTHPNKSNSGLVTLTLMACDRLHKSTGLTAADIVNRGFQEWMLATESAVDTKQESTGYLIKDMILKGPSTYDGLFVYESVVIEQMKNAAGRWQNLRVIYPKQNLWSDNPFYVIDAPWSSNVQKAAARKLLDFLLTERVQQQALVHGFRPANVNVSIKFPESPFVLYQSFGLSIDLGTVCPPPTADVITNLLASWQRGQGGR